ncbi:hypothetical protein [Actinoplanes palleronii]|uniref:hypothetical protein n=1 Tax=Actinoplanes palleronii TaxID=113570 RepID=UPI0019416049|nr:hypothetical protein [Actinoplanes palleronii]
MTGGERLERRYRRLIRVYPPGPRREELLNTLLDCAPPDRVRPTAREVGNVVRHGVRARLGRPKSRSIVVLAALAALVAGCFGAAGMSVLGWQFAPALTGVVQAQGIDRTVFPGMDVKGCEDGDEWVYSSNCADMPAFIWNPDNEGTRYGYLEYVVAPTAATLDHLTFTTGVRDRLVADGWRIGGDIRVHDGVDDLDTSVLDGTSAPFPSNDVETNVREATFWAHRDGLVLEFFDATGSDEPGGAIDPQATARFTVARSAPWWLWAMTGAGALFGIVGGWLLTGWISRRLEGNGPATVMAALPAWVCALPLTYGVLPLNEQVGRPWEEGLFVGLHAKLAAWPDLGFTVLNPVLVLAFGAFLPALAVAATIRRRPDGEIPWADRDPSF